jgi:hypothetical protein
MKMTFDNFGAVESESFSNFDTDFNYADGTKTAAISPETTQQLAQLGTQLVGRAAQNRAAQNALMPEFEVGLKSQCGSKPKFGGLRRNKSNEYETCKANYTTEFNKRAETTRATAEATATAATAGAAAGGGTTGGAMSPNMKIGLGVGALVVLLGIVYMVKK